MNKSEIIEKYSNLDLGGASYSGPGAGPYLARQLADPEEARLIMWEIFGHEGSLTKQGYLFLKEYYGLDSFAVLMAEWGGFDDGYKTNTEILDWLNSLPEYENY